MQAFHCPNPKGHHHCQPHRCHQMGCLAPNGCSHCHSHYPRHLPGHNAYGEGAGLTQPSRETFVHSLMDGLGMPDHLHLHHWWLQLGACATLLIMINSTHFFKTAECPHLFVAERPWPWYSHDGLGQPSVLLAESSRSQRITEKNQETFTFCPLHGLWVTCRRSRACSLPWPLTCCTAPYWT